VANSLLNNRLNDLKNHYSTLNTIWFITTLRFLIVIVLASLVVSILQYYGNRGLFEIGLVILILIILIFISQVLFKALDQPLLFVHRNSEKYGASNLTSEMQQAILTQLKSVLEGDKIFLQADLTLTDISRSVSASPRHVSQIINDHFNKNFFDLINSYRIQEAQRILKNARDPKLTVLEVMYQVGFNSKSSFNTQFKKKTGLTPSEFKRLHS
jgi:AraC-like DNA-binding protein